MNTMRALIDSRTQQAPSPLLPEEQEVQDVFIDNGDTLLPCIFNVDHTHIVEGEVLSSRVAPATVYKAKWLGRDVAVKKFCDAKTSLNRLLMSREANYMRRVRHPNVLNFLGCYYRTQGDTVKSASIICELMDCNLKEYVPSNVGLPLRTEGLHIAVQLARGLNHIHRTGLCHRDLKPENVLVKRTRPYAHVKIGDFGCSHLMSSPSNPNSGTRWYKAPEQFAAKPAEIIPAKLDVYSFAVVFSWILTGEQPSGGEPNIPWSQLPPDVEDLIRRCLSRKPTERPDFAEICNVLNPLLGEEEIDWSRETKSKKRSIKSSCDAAVERELEARGFNHGMSADYCIESHRIQEFSAIGQGTDAVVYKVKWLNDWYAGRALPNKEKMPDEKSRATLTPQEERAAFFQSTQAGRLKYVMHENIVQYFGFSLRENDTLFVNEIMQEDLGQILLMRSRKEGRARKRPFDADRSLSIIKKVAHGMKHLHVNMDCWHGDLHCSNIMVTAPSTCLNGWSKNNCDPPFKGHSKCLKGMKVKITDSGGDPFRCAYDYGAPEMLELLDIEAQFSDEWRSKTDDEKRRLYKQWDVYSFAVLCYQILTGFFPLDEIVRQTCRKRMETLRGGDRPPLPEDTDENLKELIKDCWLPNPDKRPDFTKILNRLYGRPPDYQDQQESCNSGRFPVM